MHCALTKTVLAQATEMAPTKQNECPTGPRHGHPVPCHLKGIVRLVSHNGSNHQGHKDGDLLDR